MMVTTVVVLSSCSGSAEDDAKDRNDSPIGWSTCNALFGAGRIDALQDEMGAGTLVVRNQTFPVDEVLSERADVAKAWEPGSEKHYANTAHPCELGLDGTNARFTSYIRWSLDTPRDIENGAASKEGWKPAGGGVYVAREDSGLNLTALFPCKVEGSHQEQEAGLPLEVETEVRNVPGFDTKLLGELTAGLARSLAKRLPCTNGPEIPRVL